MDKATIAPTPAGARADRLVRAAFDRIAAQPAPDHLVRLALELETVRSDGGRPFSSRAA